MEFRDNKGVRRFFRIEDQLKISSNETLKDMQSKLDINEEDDAEFYRQLQLQIEENDRRLGKKTRDQRKRNEEVSTDIEDLQRIRNKASTDATTIPNKNTPEQSQQHDQDDKNSLGSVSPAQQLPQQNSLQSQLPVPGPRHAPTYSVVNAILEKKEDGPGPRCGHTLTAVSEVGEEGSPGYIGSRLILFGRATKLHGLI
ncbi:hypothetical protein AgCh_023009 [Apium graveolens]